MKVVGEDRIAKMRPFVSIYSTAKNLESVMGFYDDEWSFIIMMMVCVSWYVYDFKCV